MILCVLLHWGQVSFTKRSQKIIKKKVALKGFKCCSQNSADRNMTEVPVVILGDQKKEENIVNIVPFEQCCTVTEIKKKWFDMKMPQKHSKVD